MTLGRRGVTLIELVMAAGLSAFAFTALLALTDTAARRHLHALRTSSAQMDAALAFKAIEREMSQATYLLSPAIAGIEADALSACANAAPGPGGGAPAPIDPGKPMRFFAFCRSGGTLYRHSLEGCPALYSCGSGSDFAVGGAASPVAASFLRSSDGGRVMRISVTASSAEFKAVREGSFAFAVAAGMNP